MYISHGMKLPVPPLHTHAPQVPMSVWGRGEELLTHRTTQNYIDWPLSRPPDAVVAVCITKTSPNSRRCACGSGDCSDAGAFTFTHVDVECVRGSITISPPSQNSLTIDNLIDH